LADKLLQSSLVLKNRSFSVQTTYQSCQYTRSKSSQSFSHGKLTFKAEGSHASPKGIQKILCVEAIQSSSSCELQGTS
jgi:hypothetical protein